MYKSMSDEEEVKEEIIDEEAIGDLDDAFEPDDAFAVDDELGLAGDVNEEDEDFDTDYMLEDQDGNY